MKTITGLAVFGLLAAGAPAAFAQAGAVDMANAGPPPELATTRYAVVAVVDISDQTMHVYVNGQLQHMWAVSTGAGGYITPTGQWEAAWLSPNHWSRKYNAPMPWAVFYYEGYAVHATTHVDMLGRPASHGCVRLETANAQTFFQLVQSFGLDASLIAVVD